MRIINEEIGEPIEVLTSVDDVVKAGNEAIEDGENVADVLETDRSAKELGNRHGEIIFNEGGDIERVLDRALRVNKRKLTSDGYIDQPVNILFIGEGGTGKTARVENWCDKRGIHCFPIRCVELDKTDVGGIQVVNRDEEGKPTAVRITTTMMDNLQGNGTSILFLDEYNRANSAVRSSLLTLINNHTVSDPSAKRGVRKLKDFLFTVACINPSDDADQVNTQYQTKDLDPAEETRFLTHYVISTPDDFLFYVNAEMEALKAYAKRTHDVDLYNLSCRQQNLMRRLLTHPDFAFSSLDTRKVRTNKKDTTPRTLMMVLEYSEGYVDDFLDNWNTGCDNAQYDTIKQILNGYTDPKDVEGTELMSIIGSSPEELAKWNKEHPDQKVGTTEEAPEEIEDDEDDLDSYEDQKGTKLEQVIQKGIKYTISGAIPGDIFNGIRPRLRNALKNKGYEYTNDIHEADVLITNDPNSVEARQFKLDQPTENIVPFKDVAARFDIDVADDPNIQNIPTSTSSSGRTVRTQGLNIPDKLQGQLDKKEEN